MLVAMRAHSARPLPIPKCSSAVAATLPAPPAALSPVYTDVVRRESMAVTTLIGNFVGANLAAAVSARERNDSRAISRDQAAATTRNNSDLSVSLLPTCLCEAARGRVVGISTPYLNLSYQFRAAALVQGGFDRILC